MGEAKRRGSFEVRKAEGAKKREARQAEARRREAITAERISNRQRLRKMGYKTIFHYVDPERKELLLEAAGILPAPWTFSNTMENIRERWAIAGRTGNMSLATLAAIQGMFMQ